MKLRTITLSLLMVLGACILSGCSGGRPHISDNLQKSFAEFISVSDLNQSLQVRILSDDPNGLRFGSTTEIVVDNVSDKPIFLSANPLPIRLFIIQGGEWVQIRNNVTLMTYNGSDGFVLSSKAEHSNTWTPRVVPELGTIREIANEPVAIRILAIGEFMMNGQRTGVRVGAYTDSFISRP